MEPSSVARRPHQKPRLHHKLWVFGSAVTVAGVALLWGACKNIPIADKPGTYTIWGQLDSRFVPVHERTGELLEGKHDEAIAQTDNPEVVHVQVEVTNLVGCKTSVAEAKPTTKITSQHRDPKDKKKVTGYQYAITGVPYDCDVEFVIKRNPGVPFRYADPLGTVVERIWPEASLRTCSALQRGHTLEDDLEAQRSGKAMDELRAAGFVPDYVPDAADQATIVSAKTLAKRIQILRQAFCISANPDPLCTGPNEEEDCADFKLCMKNMSSAFGDGDSQFSFTKWNDVATARINYFDRGGIPPFYAMFSPRCYERFRPTRVRVESPSHQKLTIAATQSGMAAVCGLPKVHVGLGVVHVGQKNQPDPTSAFRHEEAEWQRKLNVEWPSSQNGQIQLACDPNAVPDAAPDCSLSIGNPIHVGYGNKHEPATDYAGAGRFPLAFTRWYNSMYRDIDGHLGFGWTHSYALRLDIKLETEPDPVTGQPVPVTVPRIIAHRPGGNREVFYRGADGRFRPTFPDITDRINKVDDTYVLIHASGFREIYDPKGRLTALVKPDGQQQTLAYDGDSDHLTTVTDPAGRKLTFTYQAGRLASVTDPKGEAITFTVEGGDLTRVDLPGPEELSYIYDDANHRHALTAKASAKGEVARWSYDDKGRAYESTHPGGVDRTSVSWKDGTVISDAEGHQSTLSLNRQFQRYHLLKRDGPCSAGCGGGSSIIRAYDANGFLAQQLDGDGHEVNWQRDLLGRPLHVEVVDTESETGSYSRGFSYTDRVLTETNDGLSKTVFTYDPDLLKDGIHRLDKVTSTDEDNLAAAPFREVTYTYTDDGQVKTLTGPKPNQIVTFSYHGDGSLHTVKNALGHTTEYLTYDAHGRPEVILTPHGKVEVGYDLRGRVTTRTVTLGASAPLTTTYTYDAEGYLESVESPSGLVVTTARDRAGRPNRITWNTGEVRTLDYTLRSQTKKMTLQGEAGVAYAEAYAYNAEGQLQSTTVNGNQTTIAYDPAGQPITVTDPIGRNVTRTYDPQGRVHTITSTDGGVTTFDYHGNGALWKVKDPIGELTQFGINGFGETTLTVSKTGIDWKYTRDAAGNIVTATRDFKQDEDDTSALDELITYAYDDLNRRTQTVFSDHTIAYTYDTPQEGQGSSTTGAIGRLTRVDDRSGSRIFIYDDRSQLIEERFEPDTELEGFGAVPKHG